jgi:hypothetical protein
VSKYPGQLRSMLARPDRQRARRFDRRDHAEGVLEWVVGAAGAGIVGLLIGGALIPIAQFAVAPAWKVLKSVLRRREQMA